MSLQREGLLLRVFIGEDDRWEGRPLHEALVLEARRRGLAGATVFRGFMGFGAHSRLHKAGILDLSSDLPLVIEIVDDTAKVEGFLPVIEQMVREGLATVEKATIILYRAEPGGTKPA